MVKQFHADKAQDIRAIVSQSCSLRLMEAVVEATQSQSQSFLQPATPSPQPRSIQICSRGKPAIERQHCDRESARTAARLTGNDAAEIYQYGICDGETRKTYEGACNQFDNSKHMLLTADDLIITLESSMAIL